MTENNKPPVAKGGGAESSGAGEISPDCAAIMVYATFPSVEAAIEIGRGLVEKRFAACVNILPSMISIYAWEGKIESATEAVLIAKTIASQAGDCMDYIRAHHSYDVPAVLVLPVIGGSAEYLDWLRAGVLHSAAKHSAAK